MTIPDVGAAEAKPARARLDGPVLVSNTLSGTLGLLLLAVLGAWPLALIGAAYVLTASVFLAAVYARDVLTRSREVLAWATPWLAAVTLCTLVGAGVEGGRSSWLLMLWFGFVTATAGYLAWQMAALAVRQLMAGRARRVRSATAV